MEDQISNTDYEKNFNTGYMLRANYERLSKEQREVVDRLMMTNSEIPSINAFRDGVKEFLFEKNVQPTKSKSGPSRSKGKTKEKGKGRDRDIDLDR